jgi:hypothetical protein
MVDKQSAPSHHAGTGKGEEIAGDREPGRQDTGQGGTGRPTGKSDARFSTGINPDDENPIDPSSPNLPPA